MARLSVTYTRNWTTWITILSLAFFYCHRLSAYILVYTMIKPQQQRNFYLPITNRTVWWLGFPWQWGRIRGQHHIVFAHFHIFFFTTFPSVCDTFVVVFFLCAHNFVWFSQLTPLVITLTPVEIYSFGWHAALSIPAIILAMIAVNYLFLPILYMNGFDNCYTVTKMILKNDFSPFQMTHLVLLIDVLPISPYRWFFFCVCSILPIVFGHWLEI